MEEYPARGGAHSHAVGGGLTQLAGGTGNDQIGVGFGILLGHAAVHHDGIHLVVGQVIDQIQHGLERHGVGTGHGVGDDIQFGGGSLCAHGLAGEIGQRLELVSLVSLHQNGRGDIVIVGVGEIGVLQTVGGGLHGGQHHVEVALAQRGQQVLEGHVLHLKGKTHVVGNVLSHGHVDAGVGQFALVIGIHEFEGGVVGTGPQDQSGFLVVAIVVAIVVAVGVLAAAGGQRQDHGGGHQKGQYFFHLSYLTLYSLCRLCRRPCGWKAPGVPEDMVMIQRR